ncbi:PAS domain S-box protein [Haloactinomyces albus]|uniref:Diguanylate cyclase (GGDEF)-like protein/PAS domain S-box-containing protein n=1 Tax=Haloactinomyces albus TaxID=1352928 RepID=A0AAE4CPB9_9ACTN|nr:PAS domain S-box protein [Haloactinomyces albus]MDR7304256.1 diguanylate cyclase (GGDEF)-like protein/PAS domain S-box-containing protein [Haloactinomyces albus]
MATRGSAVVNEMPWQTILEQAAGPVVVLDLQARVIYVNPALCQLLGRDATYLLDHPPRDTTHSEDLVLDRDVIDTVIAEGKDTFEVEKRLLRSDGSKVWTLIDSSLIRDSDGKPLFFLSQIHDISARREAELLWHRTLANAPIGMALVDLNGYWTEVNDKLCELVGYSRDELLTMHFTDLTYPYESKQGLADFADLIEGRYDTVSLEKRYRHKDGHPIWMLIRASVVPGADEQPAYLVSQYETIGGEWMRDSHLAHMALHDPLTGLANRALLLDRLGKEHTKLSEGEDLLAVVLADLDELKPVNDRFGHTVGDQLLTTAAHRLLDVVRPDDTVARFGGDEFVVLARITDLPTAEALRGRVEECLNTDVVAAGHHLNLSASVGLATTRDPETSTDALLHRADRDMYRHKARSHR